MSESEWVERFAMELGRLGPQAPHVELGRKLWSTRGDFELWPPRGD